MSHAHSKIAILEGQWFPNSNLSMRRIFDMMCESEIDNINGYHYEMACSACALEEALPRLIETKHISYIFLGQHGDGKGRLCLPNNNKLSIQRLAKIIDKPVRRKKPSPYRLRGLHLSSCGLMTKKNARELLRGKRLDWVSGYSKECDWLESTLLDTLFASYLYDRDEARSVKQIEDVATQVWKLARGMAKDAGFSVFRKDGDSIKRLTPKA